MRTVDIHEAKTRLSKLIDSVLQGNEIVIPMAGKPVAMLRPIAKKSKRRFGVLKGNIRVATDFDAPLPENLTAGFEKV